ncbi:hypothetical protein EXW34_31300 (plasmid) [Bacillus mycoides]|uniref:hypothetical protein n=1 Tax=Bacillus mycoides TaxID=1405 RepID=UPI001C009BAA|nr:hypothetical protein [Bacillus mycoides]QWI25659.1 hypothetical protein EXW34_31300 [Bacillus mycoides]
MIVQVKTQKQLEDFNKTYAENNKNQNSIEKASTLNKNTHLFLLEKEGSFIGTLEVKSPSDTTLEYFDLPRNHNNKSILEISKISIQEGRHEKSGIIELYSAAIQLGKELNADFYIQFIREEHQNMLQRRCNLQFYASATMLVKKKDGLISALLDVKDAIQESVKLQSNVEKVQ